MPGNKTGKINNILKEFMKTRFDKVILPSYYPSIGDAGHRPGFLTAPDNPEWFFIAFS